MSTNFGGGLNMLINLSNHPSASWSADQLEAASAYGEITDYAFPVVDPDADEDYIASLADKISSEITGKYDVQGLTIHLMGEFTMTVALLHRFQHLGITCVASTTRRNTVETEDRKKIVEFKFVRFRKYGT